MRSTMGRHDVRRRRVRLNQAHCKYNADPIVKWMHGELLKRDRATAEDHKRGEWALTEMGACGVATLIESVHVKLKTRLIAQTMRCSCGWLFHTQRCQSWAEAENDPQWVQSVWGSLSYKPAAETTTPLRLTRPPTPSDEESVAGFGSSHNR